MTTLDDLTIDVPESSQEDSWSDPQIDLQMTGFHTYLNGIVVTGADADGLVRHASFLSQWSSSLLNITHGRTTPEELAIVQNLFAATATELREAMGKCEMNAGQTEQMEKFIARIADRSKPLNPAK